MRSQSFMQPFKGISPPLARAWLVWMTGTSACSCSVPASHVFWSLLGIPKILWAAHGLAMRDSVTYWEDEPVRIRNNELIPPPSRQSKNPVVVPAVGSQIAVLLLEAKNGQSKNRATMPPTAKPLPKAVTGSFSRADPRIMRDEEV